MTSREKVPQSFGAYLLDDMIAEGGMAQVYQARLRGLGGFEKKLVLKIVLPKLSKDPRFIKMFVDEAKAVVKLDHPNIVSVYELGVVDKRYFMSMDRIDGRTLTSLLRSDALSAAHTAHIAAQLCDALDYAHRELGLVHRDVTPGNVMIDHRGNVRLLDFGIATPADDERDDLFGTPGYIAPELWRREAATAKSDVFSVGALLFYCLAGSPALPSDREAAKNASLSGERSTCSEEWPEMLRALIDGALSTKPGDRPSNSEIASTCREWLAHAHPQGVAKELSERVVKDVPDDIADRPEPSDPLPSSTAKITRLATHRLLGTTDEETGEQEEHTHEMTGRISLEPTVDPNGTDGPSISRRWLWVLPLIVIVLASGAWYQSQSTPVDAKATKPTRAPAATPTVSKVVEKKVAAPVAPIAPVDPVVPKTKRIRVSASATPWATVSVDGRKIGDTPIRKAMVTVGSHTIEFYCPPLGKRVSKKMTFSASKASVTLVANMTEEKPRIRVR